MQILTQKNLKSVNNSLSGRTKIPENFKQKYLVKPLYTTTSGFLA